MYSIIFIILMGVTGLRDNRMKIRVYSIRILKEK